MYGKNRMLRAFSWMLAALMLFGNLYLPGGVFAARAAQTDTKLIYSDNFENRELGTATEWVTSAANVNAEVVELDSSNQALKVTYPNKADYNLTLNLGKSYDKMTVSYRFMAEDASTAHIYPAPYKSGAAATSVEALSHLWGQMRYTNAEGGRNKIQLPPSGTDVGTIQVNTWYDIKIVYDYTADTKGQVYVNGKLTNASVYTITETVDAVRFGLFYAGDGFGACYIDDLKVTYVGTKMFEDTFQGYAQGTALYKDTVENGKDHWDTGTDGSQNCIVVADPTSGSTAGNLVLKSDPALAFASGLEAKIRSDNQTIPQKAVLQYRVYPSTLNEAYLLNFYGSDWKPSVAMFVRAGKLEYRGPDYTTTWRDHTLVEAADFLGSWHDIKVVLDQTAGKFYFYCDGELLKTDVLNTTAAAQFLMSRVIGQENGEPMYYDDIEIVNYIPVTDFAVSSTSIELEPGQTETLSVSSFAPVDASVQDVTFTSNNSAVATVTADGKISAVANGTATITVAALADPTVTKTVTVNVVSNDILYMDFEDDEDLTGWKNISEGNSIVIQEVNGNKVLALSHAGSGNLQPVYELGQEYNKITMSYSFCMTDNTGSYILPTLMTAGWARATEISAGFADAKKLSYQDANGWHPLQAKDSAEASFAEMGVLEANRWYTLKIVVDNSAETPVRVYVDGKLTDATQNSAGALKNIWARINADKTIYIDNLKLTVNDHDPVPVQEVINDIAYMDFEDNSDLSGWKNISEGSSIVIQEVNGNKVLALSRAGSGNMQPIYELSQEYNKITMSYSFCMTDNTGSYILPTLMTADWARATEISAGFADAKKLSYQDANGWHPLQAKDSAEASFAEMGVLEANRWYTLKIVVDNSAETPVRVYVDGKLTDATQNSAGALKNIWARINADKTIYIDNLKLTVNDHDPVPVVEPITELFDDDFSSWDVGTTPIGWTSNNNAVTVQVVEKNGNKVLKVSGGITASHVAVTKSLGGSYEKVTVSYKFMKADKKTAHFLPAPSKGGGEQSASVVANLWGAANYTLDGGSWTDLTTASGNVGVFNANEWYEVKIIYDATKDEKIRFYVNGELTNTLVRTATDTVDTLKMYVGKFDNNFTDFYLDDLTIVPEGIDEVVYMDFEDGATADGWTKDKGTVEVKEVRGNQVLVLKNDETSNMQVYYRLDKAYDKLVMSYSFCMPDNSGTYHLPNLASWSNGGAKKTNFGTPFDDTGFRHNEADGWPRVKLLNEATGEYANAPLLEANRWYTVKIVVDNANTETPVQVWLDGKLTDITKINDGAVDTIMVMVAKNQSNKPLYIDNLLITEKDHDPIPVIEIPNEILDMDFEDVTLGTNGRGQAEGWTNSDPANANMFVQDIRGNKVLAMNNNSIDGHTHITYNLPRAYEKATLSYSFMMTKEGVASGLFYLPSTGTRGNGDQNVTVGTNSGYYNLAYTLNGGTWVQIQLKNEQTGEFENFAGWEADRWYTVKIVQDLSNTEAPIQVYLDGKLTNAQPRLTNAFDIIRIVLPKYGYGNILYLDNIVATVEDHTPVAPTEPGAVEAVPTAISLPAAYNLPVGGHLYLDLAVTPADLVLPEFTYTSSNSAVVTVDEYGEILALKEGSAVITVTSVADPTVSAATTVTVAAAGVIDTIYVAPNGKADAAGTQTDPVNLQGALALIAAKNDNMAGNIEVILADGYYRLEDTLEITNAHSGTNNYTVVWKAADGATPVIGSAYTVDGTWTEDPATGIWSVSVPERLESRQLFVDNVRATRARSEGSLTDASFWFVDGKNKGYESANTELATYQHPEDLEFVYYAYWTRHIFGVNSVQLAGSKVQITMDVSSTTGGWVNAFRGSVLDVAGAPEYYENALELLDEPGEWYLDIHDNKLYYMPRVWENMADVTVTLPTIDGEMITITGSDYDAGKVQNITFQGITFADTTWMRPSSETGHYDAQNNQIREGSFDLLQPAAVAVRKGNAINFTGCTFTRLGINALQFLEGTHNSFVVGNHFFDISGGAVNVGDPNDHGANMPMNKVVKNCDVNNNYIHNIGVDYLSSSAISVGFAADVDSVHNEIFNVPYSGYHIGYGWASRFPNQLKNTLIANNFVHDYMGDGIYDGGGIYVLGNTSGDGYNIVRDNYVKHQMDAMGALYSDQGSTWWKWQNNVVDLSETEFWNYDTLPNWASVSPDVLEVYYEGNYVTTGRYADTSNGAVSISGTVVYDPDNCPAGAQAVIDASGLEAAYAGLRNNQAERIITNLPDADISLEKDQTFNITVSFTDGKDRAVAGSNTTVKYAVADPAVATVSESGVVTGVATGVTKLYVYVLSNNILDVYERQITVGDTLEDIVLNVDGNEITMSVAASGKQLQVTVLTVLGRELQAETVVCRIADTNVATVDANGYIQPVAKGVTAITVTATVEGKQISKAFRLEITDPVDFVADNAWEMFDADLEDTWVKSGTVNSWQLTDGVKIDSQMSAYATFTGKQYGNELLTFKLKADTTTGGGSWTPGIVLRAQTADSMVSSGATGYIFGFGRNGIELHRFVGTMRYQIYGTVAEGENCTNMIKQGGYITDSPWTLGEEHEIQVGALTDGGSVRLLLKIDDVTVIDFVDEDVNGAIVEPGYFGIVDRNETITLTKLNHAAQIGNTGFETLEAAFTAARPGETVKLLADTQATDLVLTKDITLDLNGHALTADYLVVFGNGKVVDTAGDGLLKCANVRLAANNPMMPVWDDANNAKGYRFFDMVKYQQYKTQDANGFVFEAKPALGKAANDPYLAAMDSNRLTVKARIYWQSNSGNAVEQLFTFKAADVEKVYQADNMVLQLTVTGAGAYAGKLWTSIRIESETGVIWEGVDAQPYTGVSGQ